MRPVFVLLLVLAAHCNVARSDDKLPLVLNTWSFLDANVAGTNVNYTL